MLRCFVLLALLASCKQSGLAAGSQYKKRTDSEVAATPATGPTSKQPVIVVDNTPEGLPKPADQEQPPLPPVTPPVTDQDEETGTSTTPPIPGRPFGGGIGADCTKNADCGGGATECLENSAYPGGMCSKPCSRYCPDVAGVQTLCVPDAAGSSGICAPKCTVNSDCRSGYKCALEGRFMDATTASAKVCVPTVEQPRTCPDMLADILPFAQSAPQTTEQWFDCNDALHTCSLRDPTNVPYVMNSLNFYKSNGSSSGYIEMSCQLAQTLFRLGYVAKKFNITAVYYKDIYKCDSSEDYNHMSDHGRGDAIDISLIEKGNLTYGPATAEMKAFLQEASKYHVFNNIYTSACNAELFADHAHADIGLGENAVRDLVSGHFEMDNLNSPTCKWDGEYCAP